MFLIEMRRACTDQFSRANFQYQIKKMDKRKIIRLWAVCSTMFSYCIVVGQPPRGPFVVSPQVLPDKKVTFRYLAPLAKEVKLSAQFEKAPLAMVKDSIGIWSV